MRAVDEDKTHSTQCGEGHKPQWRSITAAVCGLHGIGETIMTVSHCGLSAGLVRHVSVRREWVLKRSFNKDSFFLSDEEEARIENV